MSENWLVKIHKDKRNILNRLKSIHEDASFVSELASLFPDFAFVANERCGSWYIDPRLERHIYSVYFKSTDGHTGQWNFNVRRASMHLIDAIASHSGCILVDSTRSGKQLPDALSKTVPIWCCTVNRAVDAYRRQCGQSSTFDPHDLAFFSPPAIVPKTEHAQIEANIDSIFVQRLLDSGIDMQALSEKLCKPLRPIWFTPQSKIMALDIPDYSDASYWPVICVCASQQVKSGSEERPGYVYVQGAADDHESWSLGLERALFWNHLDEILSATRLDECKTIVQDIVASAALGSDTTSTGFDADVYASTYDFIDATGIAVGDWHSGKPPACWTRFDVVINCDPQTHADMESQKTQHYLHVPISEGKHGQREITRSIERTLAFVQPFITDHKRILVHSKHGKDRSVGLALSILLAYFDESGQRLTECHRKVDKKMIQRQLVRITMARSKAQPSRATLKKVNLHFMGISTTATKAIPPS